MSLHRCHGEGYPPGGIVCLCIRGVDHDEEFFGVPLDPGVSLDPDTHDLDPRQEH